MKVLSEEQINFRFNGEQTLIAKKRKWCKINFTMRKLKTLQKGSVFKKNRERKEQEKTGLRDSK